MEFWAGAAPCDDTAATHGMTYTYRGLAMHSEDPWGGTYSQQASFTAP